MKPQKRPVSHTELARIELLYAGASTGALMLVWMRQRGLRFDWLLLVCIGMVMAARVLAYTQFVQAGVMVPW